ncbi:MAG: glycosyltransferase [Proteobacteria bacterium]|nr:glycosyltransferase [Pseudomonadota bacterium]
MTVLRPHDDHASAPDAAAPAVSVVVPVLNGGSRLLSLLDAVARQRVDGEIEILLADSGSTDGCIRAAHGRVHGLRTFDVVGTYDHGRVRTALVEAARAPLVALLSQDAVPVGMTYLAALARALDEASAAGAYARQVPRAGADPLVRATLERWTPAGATVVLQRAPEGGLASLAPSDRMARARFDNVGSMVRREAVAALPFPSRPFGEDLAWGAAILEAGGALAYAPEAVVEHHHDPTLRETFDRHRVAHRQACSEFGLRSVPSLPAAAVAWAAGIPRDVRDGGPTWAVRGAPRRAAALLGQWLGGREGQR